MVWDVGKKIKDGQYTIQGVLGEGRFGITYRASDRNGHSVVIKTPKDVGFKLWESERLQRLFWQEASKLKGCDHPHIVQVKELFSEGKANCMVMEYIDGTTLDRRSPKILPEKVATAVAGAVFVAGAGAWLLYETSIFDHWTDTAKNLFLLVVSGLIGGITFSLISGNVLGGIVTGMGSIGILLTQFGTIWELHQKNFSYFNIFLILAGTNLSGLASGWLLGFLLHSKG